jgi:hypothetical protein
MTDPFGNLENRALESLFDRYDWYSGLPWQGHAQDFMAWEREAQESASLVALEAYLEGEEA